jgi:hypothetical protein
MRLFTGQKKRLTLTMLDMAVAEEASSIPAVKKPSAKEMRKEETLAGMEQRRGGG